MISNDNVPQFEVLVTQTQVDVNLSVHGCLKQGWFKEGKNYVHCVPMLHKGGTLIWSEMEKNGCISYYVLLFYLSNRLAIIKPNNIFMSSCYQY